MSKKPNNRCLELARTLLLITAPFLLTAWHEVGGGGDPLRLLFANAQQQAAVVVDRMHPDAFSADVSPQLKTWILDNKKALAADIVKSVPVWIETAEASCGHASPGIVELSYPTCRLAVHSQDDALFTLIHEAVHHFDAHPDQPDEAFADAVAGAVLNAMKTGILDWQSIPASPLVSGRSNHSAVWTGSKMIVFGGVDVSGQIVNSGAIFDPASNQWTAINSQGAPARAYHQAIWTGQKMIVWGGLDPTGGLAAWSDSGAIYDPSNGSWTSFRGRRAANAVVPNRTSQTVVWTGTRMIVWGGNVTVNGRSIPEGGIFNPDNMSWSDIRTAGAPLRYSGHSAVWTGSQMIVWGGKPLPGANGSAIGETNEGGIWDLATNSWTAMRVAGAPSARTLHQAIWTGDAMLIFGGNENLQRGIKGTGGVFKPSSNSWSQLIVAETAPQRTDHTALWTGSEMLVWGGKQSSSANSFNIVNGIGADGRSIRAISAPSAPAPRSGHSAVWTGMSMIVFGGTLEDGRKAADGGLFYP